MKTLFTTIICGLLGFSSMANNSTSLTTEMLTHQIWITADKQGSTVYYDFQEPSILDIIEENNGRLNWTTAFWHLFQKNGQDYILIHQMNATDDCFLIVLNVNDLVLSNTNSELVLHAMNEIGTITKSELIGKWKSPFYHKRSGKIATGKTPQEKMWKTGFEFHKDGTFQRHIQIGSYVEAESGIWNLSSDGQFIKLHFTVNGNAEEIYKKEVMNIDSYTGKRIKLSTDVASNGNNIDEFELLKK